VAVLGRLLQRCVSVMPSDAPSHAPAAIIATHALRTLAGMAAFPTARAQLLARLLHPLNAECPDAVPWSFFDKQM
jgi:predicted RNA polymerase sigma factor